MARFKGIKRTKYKDNGYIIELVDRAFEYKNKPYCEVYIFKGSKQKAFFDLCFFYRFEEVKALINGGFIEFYQDHHKNTVAECAAYNKECLQKGYDPENSVQMQFFFRLVELCKVKEQEIINAYYLTKAE